MRPRRLGRVTGADGVYKFPRAETGLILDARFYTAERRAFILHDDKPIPFAPDLAVDVVSPSQDADDMAAKARVYLNGGTRLVWVVWPQSKHVDVWRPTRLDEPAQALVVGDSLDGEDVNPVAEIFVDPLA